MRQKIGFVSSTKTIDFYYIFPSNELQVQQDYLVYDINGLIGSVGGTLGLFIGFSFYDLLKQLMNNFMNYIIYKFKL